MLSCDKHWHHIWQLTYFLMACAEWHATCLDKSTHDMWQTLASHLTAHLLSWHVLGDKHWQVIWQLTYYLMTCDELWQVIWQLTCCHDMSYVTQRVTNIEKSFDSSLAVLCHVSCDMACNKPLQVTWLLTYYLVTSAFILIVSVSTLFILFKQPCTANCNKFNEFELKNIYKRVFLSELYCVLSSNFFNYLLFIFSLLHHILQRAELSESSSTVHQLVTTPNIFWYSYLCLWRHWSGKCLKSQQLYFKMSLLADCILF